MSTPHKLPCCGLLYDLDSFVRDEVRPHGPQKGDYSTCPQCGASLVYVDDCYSCRPLTDREFGAMAPERRKILEDAAFQVLQNRISYG